MKVNPNFLKKVKKYGAFDISKCFNCGNCTAVCPLSAEDASFPRKMIRYAQVGAQKEIESSLDPWLCYYCGECSDTCPRQAYPGEFMMTLRRYLIAKYDITGISGFFYRFPWIQNILVAGIFAFSLGAFAVYKGDFQELAAKIELAFPVYVTLAIAAYVFTFYRKTILDKAKKILISFDFSNIKETLIHGLTQKNFSGCSDTDRTRWIAHLLVMSGYTLTLVISNLHLLEPLKKHYGISDFATFLVFYAAFAILAGGFIMMYRRAKKKAQSSSFSHSTDWLFVVMLFLIGFTTAVVHISNMILGPQDPRVEMLYKINIAVEVAWIIIIVPFTKWIHIFFRPMAVYLRNLKKEEAQGKLFSMPIPGLK
ncbi:MAG: 4Fe-4S dicluster domain-containing protein [Elusimicrobia bacterium]|nr:4Fe-4S dicluster domain-containing protein [Elusimicrobiota bacterium]